MVPREAVLCSCFICFINARDGRLVRLMRRARVNRNWKQGISRTGGMRRISGAVTRQVRPLQSCCQLFPCTDHPEPRITVIETITSPADEGEDRWAGSLAARETEEWEVAPSPRRPTRLFPRTSTYRTKRRRSTEVGRGSSYPSSAAHHQREALISRLDLSTSTPFFRRVIDPPLIVITAFHRPSSPCNQAISSTLPSFYAAHHPSAVTGSSSGPSLGR